MNTTPKPTALTGIKPTGTPHLGNYLGMIRPALALQDTHQLSLFVADYHALTTFDGNGPALRDRTLEVATVLLACGLNSAESLLYRQSDVPETFELSVILSNFVAKGMLNRSHAYKTMVEANEEADRFPDDGVNVGLFSYPVLMAADILIGAADVVPVGKDQKQHLEIAEMAARSLNSAIGREVLRVPVGIVSEATGVIPGLDGRKMSKSYGNTIEFLAPEKQLRKQVRRIVTDSRTPDEPKDPDSCAVFRLFSLVATESAVSEMADRYRAGGLAYVEAKDALTDTLLNSLSVERERYNQLCADPSKVENVLSEGAEQARDRARKVLRKVRKAVGAAT